MRKGLYALCVTFVLIMGVAAYLGVTFFFPAKEPRPDAAPAYARLAKAKASKLEAAYTKWVARHERNGGDQNIVLSLAWSKAFSKEFTSAHGHVKLDLIDGSVSVQVQGIGDSDISDVWLVDNQPGSSHSAAPEPGDNMLWVGTLQRSGEYATLNAEIGNVFEDFEVDLVAVTQSGKDPSEAGMLFSSQGLFQRLYTRARTGHLTAPEDSSGSLLLALGPKPAYAAVVFPSLDAMVIEGADLFFNATFGGNGRTCGTCHPADNNFTIDPVFVASLPCTDKLFVAEHADPAKLALCPDANAQDISLATNFENPVLMRRVGMILENTNGFPNPHTMRGVPHTLGLDTSLVAAPPVSPPVGDFTTTPPNERTGWSGDGAPSDGTLSSDGLFMSDGSLKAFAIGAIRQHFPKTLNRVPGEDFVFPTDGQLEAMLAFQLFLGRNIDPDISMIIFKNPVVNSGNATFGNAATGKCFFCHGNAGATSFGANLNFNTGVEGLPSQPADLFDPNAVTNPPGDDGFGSPPSPPNLALDTFNTPPVIEAADTPPFFHNNSVNTIEAAVAFYNSDAFNNSPAGMAIGGIDLETTEVEAVAAFARVINALENIRSANESLSFIVNEPKSKGPLIDLATAEIKDAIQVLYAAGLHPIAKQKLTLALDELKHGKGNALVSNAMGFLQQARDELACTAPVANNVFDLAACP